VFKDTIFHDLCLQSKLVVSVTFTLQQTENVVIIHCNYVTCTIR